VNLGRPKPRMSHAEFRKGNAMRLPMVDASVEVVTSDGVVSLLTVVAERISS